LPLQAIFGRRCATRTLRPLKAPGAPGRVSGPILAAAASARQRVPNGLGPWAEPGPGHAGRPAGADSRRRSWPWCRSPG